MKMMAPWFTEPVTITRLGVEIIIMVGAGRGDIATATCLGISGGYGARGGLHLEVSALQSLTIFMTAGKAGIRLLRIPAQLKELPAQLGRRVRHQQRVHRLRRAHLPRSGALRQTEP